ncbi:hypothetical protein ACGFW5_09580 [Streptomyces sp. NPDC048416]|uniref:hypothetical protein n=1 Tax=Streptomyces sp. NPDC048416 TaxID=3365546 RepID=UPI00372044F3
MLIGYLAGPRLTELWSLRDDTFLNSGCDPSDGAGPVVLDTRWGELRVDAPGPAVREALRRMDIGPVSLRNVVADFPESGAVEPGTVLSAEATELLDVLRRIQHVVVRTIAVGSLPLLSVVPLSARARFAPVPPPGNATARLSRRTVVRRPRGGLCLESPLSLHRAELLRPEASLLLVGLGGTARNTIGAVPPAEHDIPDLPAAFVDTALSYLAAAGLVEFAEPGRGGSAEKRRHSGRPDADSNGNGNENGNAPSAPGQPPGKTAVDAAHDLYFLLGKATWPAPGGPCRGRIGALQRTLSLVAAAVVSAGARRLGRASAPRHGHHGRPGLRSPA